MKSIGVSSTKILFTVAGGLMLLLVVSLCISIEVHAAGVTTEGSHTVEISRDGSDTVCSSTSPRIPVDFSLQITDVELDVNTGEVSYKTKVSWRRCQTNGVNRQDTRAYAIFGGKYCEMSGWYGGSAPNNTDAYDCTKYVGDPSYVGTSSLTCNRSPHGTRNSDCLTSYGQDVIREENQPSSSSRSTISNFSREFKVSNNWDTYKKNNTSRTFSLGNLCQYFKYGSGFSNTTNANRTSWKHCMQASITVRWTYTPPLSYDITPSVSTVTPFTYTYSSTPNVTWNARVASLSGGTMADVGAHDVDLWRIKYAPGAAVPTNTISTGATGCPVPFGYGACTRIASKSASNPTAANPPGSRRLHVTTTGDSSGPDAVGTHTCYVARVLNPTHEASDDTVWRASSIRCSVAGIKPKIQVLGGDAKATGIIETSWSDVFSRRFGSWGEYSVLSNGANTAMGSAATLGLTSTASGSPQSSWSNLTFRNNGSYGSFNGSLAHREISQNNAVRHIGNLNLASLNELLAENHRQTIVVTGTLTISGDLLYPNVHVSIREIPKIILIANNIIINSNVRQIDPWLVSMNNISTCHTVPGFQSLLTYRLDSGKCNLPLRFNGPVIADKLYLYRTYDTVDGQPAETFNLRADAFLSSFTSGPSANPVATTSVVTEAPPRF